MHAFVIGSTFVITYLITYNCCLRFMRRSSLDDDDEDDSTIDYLHHVNPFAQYISKTELLQFFAQDSNFYKLKKVLDLSNGIYAKTLKLIENNEDINEDYENTQLYYGTGYFHHTYDIPTIMEIRDTKFKTSWGQLNYIKWLINNDYFLHIE